MKKEMKCPHCDDRFKKLRLLMKHIELEHIN